MNSEFQHSKNQQLDSEKFPEELLENYVVGNIIGDGNYSIVYECNDVNTDLPFALKVVDMAKCKGRVWTGFLCFLVAGFRKLTFWPIKRKATLKTNSEFCEKPNTQTSSNLLKSTMRTITFF
jgi:hypothetical protein